MKHFLLAVILSNVVLIHAQGPALTSASGPQIGDVFTFQQVSMTGVTPGGSGPNQVWDFSTVTDTGTAGSEYVVDPAGTSQAASFPSANLALINSNAGDTNFAYELLTANALSYLGDYIPGAGSENYSVPRVAFQYPLSYGSAYANPFAGVAIGADTITGIDSALADGYGTLKLPGQTFTNVLRLKYVQHTHTTNAAFNFDEEIYQLEYSYYITGYHNFIFDIVYTVNTVNGTSYSGNYAQRAVNITTDVNNVAGNLSFTLYPNPAHYNLTITADESLLGATVTITNVLGEVVTATKLTSAKQQVDLSAAAKGIYLVSIKADGVQVARKLVIN